MPARFNHIALYVSDLKASVAFYRDIIGAEIIPDPFNDERHVWLKIGDHNQLHLIGSRKPQPGTFHFAFAVESLDEVVARLGRAGIRFENESGRVGRIQTRADQVKQLYLCDPDGYEIEMNEDRY